MRVAAIDCGTNTIRLLVADLVAPRADGEGQPGVSDAVADAGGTGQAGPVAGGWSLAPRVRSNEIVRLGQGVDRTGRLDEAALARTLAVVEDYAAVCREQGVERMRFVATSATRDAANRDVFVDGVRGRLGIVPEVVSGSEEARLSFSGCLLGLGAASAGTGGQSGADQGADAVARLPREGGGRSGSPEGARVVVDLGGGSTELVLGVDAPVAAYSMDTGSVRVTERYLSQGVTEQGEAAARAHVRELLDRASDVVDLSQAGELVGLAGTITTVTAHALGLADFDPEVLDGSRLPVETVLASCEAILHSTAEERASWGYLRPGRRDVIAAGALVWSEVLARVVRETAGGPHPVQEVVTSLHDILDGIAVSMAPGAQQAGAVPFAGSGR